MSEQVTKTELTEAEKAAIPNYIDKWIGIGLDTNEADWELSKKAIRDCYRYAGLNPDIPYIKVESPIILTFASPLASAVINTYGVDVNENSPRVETTAATLAAVEEIVKRTYGKLVSNQFESKMQDVILNGVATAVKEILTSTISVQVKEIDLSAFDVASTKTHIKENWSSFFGGKFWVGWTAFCDFMINECKIEVTEEVRAKFEAYAATTVATGWWYPDKNYVVACNTPAEIHMQEGRLHATDKLAIRWRDGWGMAFFRGIQIPNEWVFNKPSAKEILSTENVEVRRAGAELVGWGELLEELQAVIIDEDPDPEIGTLYEADVPDSGKERFLKVDCGTGRKFVLPVPKEVTTAGAAQEWMFPTPPEIKYAPPEVRT